ncbi:MAG TPA: SDR family oxidoreductase [Thermohalobaculum sp.]|nr:SDR family oxidoreductase [Thermohalobaculum sp.]
MQFDFSGSRVLVTGGTRGIGGAIARGFLDAGARVAINGRTADSAARAVARAGEGAVAAPGDIGTAAGCEVAVRQAVEALGGLDVLVNSAGISAELPMEESDEAFWDATLDINLKGTFFCCRAALGALRASGGNIVNIASESGLLGSANLTVYCASKGGVVNMTRAMAMELAPVVRVNCVCPGYVDTDMIRADIIDKANDPTAIEREMIDYAPLKRIAQPEEVAAAVMYLASSAACFATGSALQLDGGATAGR